MKTGSGRGRKVDDNNSRKNWSFAKGCSLSAVLPALLLSLPSGAEEPIGGNVDILGTWYVLIHYTDDNTPHPERVHWEDRVWVFEKSGSRLVWQQYPIVIFDDGHGRFERRSTGQYARVLGAWEPSESQLGDIRDGLQVNDRGSKRKTLRGSNEAGWKTNSRARPGSASIITFTENWSIDGLPDEPVFERHDTLGSGRTDSLDGATRFATTRVLPSGNRLRGVYERDGTRHGAFRMMRSGSVGALKKAAKSQSELQQRAQVRQFQGSEALRQEYRNSISAYIVGQGIFLSDEQVDALTEEAIARLAEGVDDSEISRKLGESATQKFYSFGSNGAEHDDAVRYPLPFDPSVPRKLGAGVGGDVAMTSLGSASASASASGGFGHRDWSKYSFDFIMPAGVEVRAARAGVVERIGGGLVERSRDPGRMTPSTGIYVLHDDGTFAMYIRLKPEVAVEIGEQVEVGQHLGEAQGPHLHFGVVRLGSGGKLESVDIRFDDGSPAGFVPAMGLYYGGGGGE